jgi:dipeptidyl aminopeptidase/acylaminoacyl peptidase
VAVGALSAHYPSDPARVAIVGWSHGGMIALLSIFRNPTLFKAAVAMVPVTNLFHRLASKGVERQRLQIDPNNRFGGLPSEKPAVYRDRSPLFQVDRLQVPLLVHLADNDTD